MDKTIQIMYLKSVFSFGLKHAILTNGGDGSRPGHADVAGLTQRLAHRFGGGSGEPADHPQAVARLARTAVADAVGNDDEVARRIQKLTRTEQNASEVRCQESRP